MRRSRSTVLSLSALSALILMSSLFSFAAAPDRIAGPIAPQQLVKLSAGVSSKAKPEFDRGPVDPAFKLTYMTLLTVPSASQQKAITRLLSQQQDPHSPLYHQWLTSQQYADRFGLSANDIQKLTAWLQSQGFTVDYVPTDRNWIAFSGTAAQVETAFKTTLHNFEIDGKMHYANTAAPSIPSALSGIVAGIRGLNDFRPKSHLKRPTPGYSFPVNGGYQLFLAPGDIATIYDIGKLYTAGIDGTGQKLAIMGRTDVYLSDLNDFRSGFSLSALSCTTNSSNVITACSDSHFQYVLNGPDPGVNPFHSTEGDDLPEADLDIEWSGAVAYNAQIVYVNSGGTAGDVFASLYYSITNNLAPVISMSYGLCELGEAENGAFASDEAELQAANMKGITFMSSSGDSGAAGCDSSGDPDAPYASNGLAVNYPASSPETTGVGGTMIPFSEYNSTFWSATNVTDGGSAQCQVSGSPCIPEGAWNDAFEIGAYCAVNGCSGITDAQSAQAAIGIGATGGGASNCKVLDGSGNCQSGFPQPVWQTVAIGGQSSARLVPDVSLLASPNLPGYIYCTQLFELGDSGSGSTCSPGNPTGITDALSLSPNISVVGGTSASSPVFAAIVTLLNHYLVKNHIVNSAGLGNINPNLYQIAISNPSAFNPITASDFAAAPGSNQVYCEPGTPNDPPAALQCPQAVAPATEGLFGFLSASTDTLHTTGYNQVTGLGSVDADKLFGFWSSTLTANFELGFSPNPASALISQNVTWSGTLAGTYGYSKPVTLSCGTGAPSTCTFSQSTITPTGAGVPFTVSVGSSTPGTYSFNIQATDGTITNTAAVTLTVNRDFTVTAAPLSPPQAPNPGQATTTSMVVTPVGGSTFTSNVTFTCSAGLPAGATCTFNPTQITAGSTGPVTVTVTIQTTGPFTGAVGNIQRRATIHKITGEKQRLWIPLTLPLAGIVLFGLGGSLPRRYKIAGLCVVLAVTVILVACGGGGSSSTPPVTTVTPANAQVQLGSTQQFTASSTVTWSLSSGAPGTISSSGLYTAPTSGTTPVNFTVVATPTSGSAGSASVSIPAVAVTPSPSTVSSLYPSLPSAPAQTQQFTATVSNSSANQSVTWAVAGGNANGTISAAGLYTAPATLPNPTAVTVTATSVADPSKSGSATVNLLTPTPAGTSTVTITAAESTDLHTTNFSLTVN